MSTASTSVSGAVDAADGLSHGLTLDPIGFMGDSHGPQRFSIPPGLDPHQDARAIVRIVQCPQCSLPLRAPITLPCGNSLCKACLPPPHKREKISYPMTTSRQEGIQCPFEECGRDHSMGDCSLDVTLAKVLERISIEVARYRPLTPDTPTLLDERLHWRNVVDSSALKDLPHSRVLHGGRLLATYTMAEIGELRYDSEVAYQPMSPVGDSYRHLDVAMLENLKEATKNEMDCQVCYALLLDPLTTTCGHTFCRKCVARVLDHSNLCPICRRTLLMPPGVQAEPSNLRLSKLLLSICPEHVATRAEAATQEELNIGEVNVPLFVCALAYPAMPTFLHVFEPRYRLMIRRAIESGDRKFGMMMYNQQQESQGELGITDFVQYGTLLHIVNMHLMPDGRSLIETIGVSRFRVKSWEVRDGYIVGKVERIDDISLAEEERIEAAEVSTEVSSNDILAQMDNMSTRDLLQISTGFITRMRAASASWLRANVIASHGSPPEDPALFPYWFASILPIADEEKCKLLPTTSVRERLKIIARWVRRIEAQRWDDLAVNSSDSESDAADHFVTEELSEEPSGGAAPANDPETHG